MSEVLDATTTHLRFLGASDGLPRPETVSVPDIPTLAELLEERFTDELKSAFPDLAPPIHPTGINILVQLRTEAKTKTLKGGKTFWLPDESIDAQKARAQTAVVRAVGPAAYRDRRTLELWPEGHWCVPGMFIRVPMYGGDRLEVTFDRADGSGDFVLFATFRDQDCLGVVVGDPLKIRNG